MCNKSVELASNPFTINITVAMSPDPEYEVKISTWDKIKYKFAKAIKPLIDFSNKIPWYGKLLIGLRYMAMAIVLSIFTYGTATAVRSSLIPQAELAEVAKSKSAYDNLKEALDRKGLDAVPAEGLNETWIEGNYQIQVRVHGGNPQFTSAKQIFRVARRAYPLNYLGWE